jgi:alpha-D-xyloside xylohydrolase
MVFSCTKHSNKSQADFQKQFPGIWKMEIGKPDKVNLLNTADIKPRKDVLAKFSEKDFPIVSSEMKFEVKQGRTYLRFPLGKDEQIYGLGLNFKTVHQRGKIQRLHVDHYGGRDNGRTHAPVPLIISSKGYGILINSAKYIDAYIGTGVSRDSDSATERDRNTDRSWTSRPKSDNIEFVIPDNGTEIYVFAANSVQEVMQRYNLFCGGGYLPPKWGLGFWQRTPTLFGQKEVSEEIDGFKKHNFPLDVLGLEPGWHSASYPCSFDWDKGRFPTPDRFIEQKAQEGIRFNVWINPYVAKSSSIYDKIKPYTGSHTVWCGAVPDFNTKAAKILGDHFNKTLLDKGISGLKIDEVDGFDHWLWPDIAQFPSGINGETMRQIYGTMVQKWSANLYKKRNERTYGLVRAANAGCSSFPYVIYNDYYRHQDFITALINSSFSGVLWTPELRASKSSEEWVRRMQSVCFSPMAMLNAWADGTKPWTFSDVYKYCQDVAFLRMRLLPYIYSTFADYYFKGIPPFRAMQMEEGFYAKEEVKQGKLDGTKNPYAELVKREIKDQYMMGKFMLVAPMFKGQKQRTVVLPKGNWYDFYTGEYVGNGEKIVAKHGLDKIPLYVKDGGIIPMMKAIRQTKELTTNMPLTARIYGKKAGEFELYDDDGKSFDYQSGKYSVKKLSVKDGKTSVADVHKSNVWSYGNITWKCMTK